MNKLIALASLLIFFAYCWAANLNYTYIEVPSYVVEEVDPLGGKTLTAWENDSAFQAEHLGDLESERYQPMPEGLVLPDGTQIPGSQNLREADFRALIAGGKSEKLSLRNPAAVSAVAQKKYVVRNKVDTVDLIGGEPLDKTLLDRLIAAGISRVAVTGKGDVVGPDMGTILMTIIIFIGLVAALKDVLWNPILSLIDARRAEIDEGRRLARENHAEALRVEDEGKKLRAGARQEYLTRLHEAQRAAMKEADVILGEAHKEAAKITRETMEKIDTAATDARTSLEKETPAIARSLAESVLGRSLS